MHSADSHNQLADRPRLCLRTVALGDNLCCDRSRLIFAGQEGEFRISDRQDVTVGQPNFVDRFTIEECAIRTLKIADAKPAVLTFDHRMFARYPLGIDGQICWFDSANREGKRTNGRTIRSLTRRRIVFQSRQLVVTRC